MFIMKKGNVGDLGGSSIICSGDHPEIWLVFLEPSYCRVRSVAHRTSATLKLLGGIVMGLTGCRLLPLYFSSNCFKMTFP